MMVKDLKQSPDGDYPWMKKVQRYIAYGQKGRALQVLEKVIERDMPLFHQLPEVLENRRLAWPSRLRENAYRKKASRRKHQRDRQWEEVSKTRTKNT